MLSGYRIMWMTVMFDLPVKEDDERRAANKFRLALKDLGFEMLQLSVYSRFLSSSAQKETYCKKVESVLPSGGKVNILLFTDKQYERIITFHGRETAPPIKPPDQLALF